MPALPAPSEPNPNPPDPPPEPVPVAIRFVRHPRARRYILRVDRQGVRVTIPRGGSEAFARQFVAARESWIRTHLARLAARLAPAQPWGPGTPVWYRGERHPLVADPTTLRLGDLFLPLPPPDTDWRSWVEAALRHLATIEFPPLVLAMAAHHQLAVRHVSVRAQRTRWGSCSRNGTVSLNWRLVQTPRPVRDYLIAHELAHLREMNHSPRFWRVVDRFFPGWHDSEAWLRRHGRDLLP
ncbi:MAG: M48 family metallopeptidase [Verrucomicrobiae bacterium]|nr:M48 family metallopeptidase [Verrucomicrobiae bacterium]